jgi:hypothetical protein
MSYLTVNITCNRCKETNFRLFDTIYHFIDCDDKDMIYENGEDGQQEHGFDLCNKCYKEEPNYTVNFHKTQHNFQKITRNQMIHYCAICDKYYCAKCRITSELVEVFDSWEWLEHDNYDAKGELYRKSICLNCMKHFQCPKLLEVKREVVGNLPLPSELKENIQEFI